MSWSEAHRVRALCASLCGLLLAACGFHLRGDVSYPPAMATTYIDTTDRFSPFYRQLRAALREGGIRVTDDAASASAVLRIVSDDTSQRVLSVSTRNTPREYEVYYAVEYSLEMGEREAIPSQHLALRREYTYDETQQLGKAEEETNLQTALATDLVGLVIRRLAAAK